MKGIIYSLPLALLLWLLLATAIAKADFTTDYNKWRDNAVNYGRQFCALLSDPACGPDCQVASIYYDQEKVFRKIQSTWGGAEWTACALKAQEVYLNYIGGNALQVPGYRNFTEGLALGGDKATVYELSTKAAYARQESYGEDINNPDLSREISYAIVSYLDAENAGYPLNPLYDSRISAAFTHFNRWFVVGDVPYVRPFMVALSARALIRANAAHPDLRTVPVLRSAADWLWNRTWIQQSRAFAYTDRVHSSGGTEPAPDLNLLIAPLYYWLYSKTGEVVWRDRGDAIFEGGVNQAFFASGKQFNQNYFWMFEGIMWRTLGDAVVVTPTPTPTKTPTRIPTATPTPAPCSYARSLVAHDCRLKRLEEKVK